MSFIDIAKQVSNIQGIVGAIRNVAQFIGSFLGQDLVGVFDNDTFDQLFVTARPMSANVIRQQKIMDHPIETGAIISDFAIVLPVVVEMHMLLSADEYLQTYADIKAYYLSQTQVALMVKADTFGNMVIEGMPHEENPEMFDVIPLTLRFREVQLVAVQYQALPPQKVTEVKDQSTVNRGVQQPKTSVLYDIAKGVHIIN